jgi:hypothetical protein
MQGSPSIGDRIEVTAAEVRDFLASPAGRRLRRIFAASVIVAAPLLFRAPVFRRHPLLRLLEAIGGVALLIKAAEAIRDWDAGGQTEDRVVIDVPPAS